MEVKSNKRWCYGTKWQLISFGGNKAEKYNESRLRTSKTVNGAEHRYYWTNGKLSAEICDAYSLFFHYDANGDIIVQYIFGSTVTRSDSKLNSFNSYYVDGCDNKEISHRFLRVILSYSDAFSLIFFRYRENEKLSKTASMIKKKLEPYKLFSQNVTEWPGTTTENAPGHIYRMVTYRADIGILPVLEEVTTLWDWDYPSFPMDPCFYKNGYAWFEVSTHEHWNRLFLNESPSFPLASDLESIGVTLVPGKTAKISDIYYNSKIAHL